MSLIMSLPSSFNPGHYRSRSHNELLSQLKYNYKQKKRSYSDIVNDGCLSSNKRSKTVPPYDVPNNFLVHKKSKSLLPYTHSPSNSIGFTLTPSISPISAMSNTSNTQLFGARNTVSSMEKSPGLQSATVHHSLPTAKSEEPSNEANRSGVKTPDRATFEQKPTKLPSISNLTGMPNLTPSEPKASARKLGYNLPTISSVLNSHQDTGNLPVKLKPITPTASLHYLDTNNYSDNQWKYDLLDKLDKNLNKYPHNANKPVFDSKISPKFEQLHPNIKQINFPYESNYTYLNKTYMNDIENYPQYLELAKSLVDLSRSKPKDYPTYSTSQNHESANKLADSPLPTLSKFTTHNHSSHRNHHHSHRTHTTAPSSPSPKHTSPAPALPSINSYVPGYTLPQETHYHSGYDHEHKHKHHSYQKSSLTPQTSPIVQASQTHKFIPITPPMSQKKFSSGTPSAPKSPPKNSQRVCISCGSDQSPCWRPSWSIKSGQLCNSCGLRYKKTSARCLNDNCRKIPAKGEWSLQQSKGKIVFEDGVEGYSCLECGWRVEVKK